MKLYAKTRSERAEKGQGGNEFIEVKLTVQISQSTHEIGILRLIPQGDNYILALDRSSFGRDPKESCRVYEELISIKPKKFSTYYSFKDVGEFQKFFRNDTWESGELDYVTVGGHVFTLHEYDHDGKYMSWGNKKHDELIECCTQNRYRENGYCDAELNLFKNYGLLRDDISFIE